MPIRIDNKTYAFKDLLDRGRFAVGDYLRPTLDFVERWYDSNDYISVPTSGSTGTPKSIHLLKSAMTKSARKTLDYFELSQGDHVLLALPTRYIGGMMMLVRAMKGDLILDLMAPSSKPLVSCSSVRYDFVPLTPHQFMSSYAHDPACFQSVSKILLGGGPASKEVNEIVARIESEVYHGFGMTETITHIAVRNLSARESEYKALRGVTFGVGEKDNLIISADHLSERIITNDVVELGDIHTFRWLGRMDNVINSGGIKVHPELLEERLTSLLKEKDFFVAGIQDSLLGERIVLVIKGKQVERGELDFNNLARHQVPKEVRYLPNFVYTETGKINRAETLKLIDENN